MTKPLAVVVVGAGMVAELHVQAMRSGHFLELCGFVEIDEQTAARRRAEWGVRRYRSVEEALSDAGVEAMLVLTPESAHEEVATTAMRAGRHVLVEKPVGSADAVRRLAAVAAAEGVVCMPGHNYAYQPEFTAMRELLHSGAFGQPRAAWITYVIAHPEDVARHYGGVLDEVMVHHTYLMLALFGPPTEVHAGCMEPAWRRLEHEDQAWMTWHYPRGLSAHLFASFAVDDDTSDPWTFVVKVLGTNGGATYTWRSAVTKRAIGTLTVGIPAYEASYQHEHAAFRAAVERTAPLTSTLADADQVAQILQAAHRASEQSGIRVQTT